MSSITVFTNNTWNTTVSTTTQYSRLSYMMEISVIIEGLGRENGLYSI